MPRYSRGRDDGDSLPKAKVTRESLREAAQLFGYLKPYRYKFAGAMIALFCSGMLALAFPYLVGRLVNNSLHLGQTETTHFTNDDVNRTALLLIGALGTQAFFSFFASLWFAQVGESSLADLRRDTYARLIRLPMTFFSTRRVGELSSRIASDLAQVQDTLIGTMPHILRQTLFLFGGVVLITRTSLRLTGVMLATVPVLIGITLIFGRLIRRYSRDSQDRLAESNVVIDETLQGIQVVKAFTNEDYEINRYALGLHRFLDVALRGAWYRGAFVSFIVFALFGGIVFVLWYGAGLVLTGSLTVGELTSFMIYTMFVAGALGTFPELYSQIQRTLGATQRVRELLQETPESDATIPTWDGLPSPSIQTDGLGSPSHVATQPNGERTVRGEVIFEHVSFRYPSRPEFEVLRDINLEAQPGQRIALVGPSGAGKSTVTALLLRFYDPDAGRILIDGRDARQYPLHELRRHMALVPQDVSLFGGTIMENIAYGRPGADEAAVIAAARQANAHDFVASFPDGYRTLVGDRGIQLSGGQRQRVAIARAILKDPAILILDEATSSLDSESESLVQQALDVLMRGRTSLIIAHRLSTVRTADRIYVLKEGKTIESGTHAELMERRDGIYRNLSELQFELR